MKFDNTRIQKLRSAMLVQPSICVERAKLITESYRATEGEGRPPIRRAKAFAHLLKAHDHTHLPPMSSLWGRPTSKVRGRLHQPGAAVRLDFKGAGHPLPPRGDRPL